MTESDYTIEFHENTRRGSRCRHFKDHFNRIHRLMPKLEEVLIDRLTLRTEVHAVHSKTSPGTGYDIGKAKTGLPAICAFIASKAYVLIFPYMRVFFSLSSVDL